MKVKVIRFSCFTRAVTNVTRKKVEPAKPKASLGKGRGKKEDPSTLTAVASSAAAASTTLVDAESSLYTTAVDLSYTETP